MRRFLRDDEGAVAIIVVLLLLVMFGLTALVVDAGYMYSVRRQLQAAADGAALAACQEVILGVDPDVALDVAEKYVEGDGVQPFNSVKPADGVEMVESPPDTVATNEIVRVTVTKDTGLFFGKTLGMPSRTIRAQATAKVAYLTGLKGIVPWAVPIVRARRVTARVGSGSEVELVRDPNTGTWSGSLPVDTSATGARPIEVVAYNNQTEYPDGTPNGYPDGVPERLEEGAAVTVEASGGPVQTLHLSKSYVTAGLDTSVDFFVEASSTPEVRFNGHNSSMTLVSGNLYTKTLTVPVVTQLHESFPIDVTVGQGSGSVTLESAAVLVVRRSTYPISNVIATPSLFRQGQAGASVNVSVDLVQYVYGNKYVLKVVGGGAEIGNFCALDLSTTRHTPYWRHPQDPTKYDITTDPAYGTPPYYNYLENRFPFAIDIDDTIWTEPGNMSGPQTDNALDTRFGTDMLPFNLWNRTIKSNRVVYVPVVEKMQDVTGQTPVRVVAFAAFYIDPSSDARHDIIEGYFIEFVAPADAISEDPPPTGMAIKTPHLVTSDY